MKKIIIACLIPALAAVFAANPTSALNTASTPVMATTGKFLTPYEVRTTVTLDSEALVVITSSAYRHPTEVEYTATLPAGTHTIVVDCDSTRLPHAWTVTIDGVRASSASLKCE